MNRFYNDSTPSNPDGQNAVFLKGIRTPMWVAINETMAKEAVVRLNQVDSAGGLKGWRYMDKNSLGVDVSKPGWTIDDFLGATKNGEPTREQIRQAGTLLQAIAVVANNKMKRSY